MPKVTITDKKGLVQAGGKGVTSDSLVTLTGGLNQTWTAIADASDDTSITTLERGKIYSFGTTTGLAGDTDGNNAMTFKLPTPKSSGEKIVLYHVNAAVVAKLLGFVTTLPATETITYWAYAQQVFIETATTATGVNGSANTMVKISTSQTILGDIYTFTSMSTTNWRMDLNDATNILASGDIAVDPGNSSGYID